MGGGGNRQDGRNYSLLHEIDDFIHANTRKETKEGRNERESMRHEVRNSREAWMAQIVM